MTKTFPGWQEGNYDMLPSHTAPVAQSMEALYMSLRSLESRRLYAVVGHSAFTGCNWAAEPFDYVYWLVPRIVISYVCMATIIGIATMTQRKRFWRLYGSLILLGGVIYEGYELNLAIASIQSNDNKPMVHHVSTHYMIRCFAFAALSTVIYLFDKADEWTDAEKLKSVIERQRGIYKRLTSTRLAKASVLGDSSLRATFFEFHKQQQAHIEAMMNDEEYTNLRKDVMTRLNLEQLNAEAQALSSNIVVAATQEGLLQSPQPET
ncbi:hypothetical protein HK101_007627 [Irineochytrium annulatum]|nr:hypothetical protein HK101_007627 [Irineochytrium annulatum]